MLHENHLNKGCYGMLHTSLKCKLVNFDTPNRFLYYGNLFGIIVWDPKSDKITFQMGVCTVHPKYILYSSEFHVAALLFQFNTKMHSTLFD